MANYNYRPSASGALDTLGDIVGGAARVAGKVLTSDTTRDIAKAGIDATKGLVSGIGKAVSNISIPSGGYSAGKIFGSGNHNIFNNVPSYGNRLLDSNFVDTTADLVKSGAFVATKMGEKILSETPKIFSNRANFSTIDKSDLFSGLKSITSSVVDKIGDLDNSIINVNPERLVTFASTSKAYAKNYQGHFDTWLSLFSKIADNQLLKGAFEGKSADSLLKIKNFNGRFTGYIDNLTAKIPSFGEKIADADKSFLSLDGDFNIVKGIASGLGSIIGIGKGTGVISDPIDAFTGSGNHRYYDSSDVSNGKLAGRLSKQEQEYVYQTAAKYDLDPDLVFAVMEQESSCNKNIGLNSSNCGGVMQVHQTYNPHDYNNYYTNVGEGCRILSEKMDEYNGNEAAALTAYNVGHDNGNRDYASSVLARYKKYKYGK